MTQINSAPIRFLEQFEISLFIIFRKTWMWNKVGLGFLYVDISSLFLLQDWSWTHVGKGWIGSINGEYIFLFPALVLQLFFNSIPSLINRHSMIPIRTIYFEIWWHTFVDKLRTKKHSFLFHDRQKDICFEQYLQLPAESRNRDGRRNAVDRFFRNVFPRGREGRGETIKGQSKHSVFLFPRLRNIFFAISPIRKKARSRARFCFLDPLVPPRSSRRIF